jgi:hypothetical protein
MATYAGGSHEFSSSFYHRPPTTTTITSSTASSVSANMGPTNTTMPTFSKASEGLEGVPVWIFKTIKGMQEAIDSHEEKLEASEASEASPYMIFRPVTTNDLLKIKRARENGKISRGVRLTHYVDWDILILKVPTAKHEAAHGTFSDQLFFEAALMGLRWELFRLNATTYTTPHWSKEGDSSFKPRSMRPLETDWPTIVMESGWSESITKLREDAYSWLENSRWDVKIVLLFSISQTARKMIVEKWENRPLPANWPSTRSGMTQIPTKIQAITIDSDSNTAPGAPLTLEFRKIFLRQAVPPQEHDFTFTAQDLSEFAADFWSALQ